MKLLRGVFYIFVFFQSLSCFLTNATLDPNGTKCGQRRCSTTEYCSPYDSQCRPCATICDPASHNHQSETCVKDCQEYLHDQRYVLRTDLHESQELKDEVQKLRTLMKVTLSLCCLMLIIVLYLLSRSLLCCSQIKKQLRSGWLKRKWVKNATNNNKVQDDAEIGVSKQNGLKLTMPTISGSVAGVQISTDNASPNTTSTPLSRRHPSEDTTLDYAYDNPAMTPSPEAAQPRTKRESSF
ncbi:protein grindelwald isoform X1 [Cephus cinctus]|uniref:Protein grindelwald isoform X1 n=1 Tax=Cephus cinctus TaxID=211228 RepID=A0AAJ7CCV1_CEPCN|nr:protein grindelwald isoform X1 [Cephus cinctus]